MSRTESLEGVSSSSAPRFNAAQAAAAGKWGAQLAGYALVTIAVTFMLLRPKRLGPGRRGSLFFGSGVLVVLMKTLLSTSDGSDAAPAPRKPAASVVAAVTSAPARAKSAETPQADSSSGITRTHKAVNGATVTTAPRPAAAATTPKKPVAPSTTEPATAKSAALAATPTTVAGPKSASTLGPRYVDRSAGYSVQFPAGWRYQPSAESGVWMLDATDGQSAIISVGFSKLPANLTADQIPPERVTRGLQKRVGTTVLATGYTTLGGRRAIWHKYTGPITRPDAPVRMTAVHYLLPLQDGRALELRLAATPEKFNELGPRMKQSLDTFKLLTKVAEAR
jgi:hypothetical protein